MSNVIVHLNHTEKENATQELMSMYEKVCFNMKSPLSKSVIDLYTLYDYLSFVLTMHLLDTHIAAPTANSAKLEHAMHNVQTIHDPVLFLSFFFENGKMLKNVNLEGAMLAAGFSETEKSLWRRIMSNHFKLTP
jgi:hypothetical protein